MIAHHTETMPEEHNKDAISAIELSSLPFSHTDPENRIRPIEFSRSPSTTSRGISSLQPPLRPSVSIQSTSIHSVPMNTLLIFTLEPEDNTEVQPTEHDHLLGWLPSVTLECTLSEPRDLLQNERTLLSFSKFSTALFFCAFSVILGFSFTDEKSKPKHEKTVLSDVVFSVLIFLALFGLVVALISYFQTVRRLTQGRIHTIGPHKGVVMACFTAVVVTLITVNSLLIAERYRGGL